MVPVSICIIPKESFIKYIKHISNEAHNMKNMKPRKIAKAWKEISELLLEIDKSKVEKLEQVREKIFELCESEKNV